MGDTYMGERQHGRAIVMVLTEEGAATTLDPAYHLKCLSPDGFDWGHSSRGGEQLALAILNHALKDGAAALALYKEFSSAWVRGAPRPDWLLFSESVQTWAKARARGEEVKPWEDKPAAPAFPQAVPAELPADNPVVAMSDEPKHKKRRDR